MILRSIWGGGKAWCERNRTALTDEVCRVKRWQYGDFVHLVGQKENWDDYVGKVNWEGPNISYVMRADHYLRYRIKTWCASCFGWGLGLKMWENEVLQRRSMICWDFEGKGFWYSTSRLKRDGLSRHITGLARFWRNGMKSVKVGNLRHKVWQFGFWGEVVDKQCLDTLNMLYGMCGNCFWGQVMDSLGFGDL